MAKRTTRFCFLLDFINRWLKRGDQTRFGLVLVSSMTGNFYYSRVLIWFRCLVPFFRASLQDSLDVKLKKLKKTQIYRNYGWKRLELEHFRRFLFSQVLSIIAENHFAVFE